MSRLCGAVLAAGLALTAPAAAAEGDWLKAVGNFLADGLEPARTLEDIVREEQRARQREQAAPAPSVDAAPEPPTRIAMPAPAPVPLPPAATEPAAVPPPAVTPPAAPAPVPAPQPAAAVPPPAPAPRPAMAPVRSAPLPSLPTGGIAATATLDQAIRLGGPTDLYGRRIRAPIQE
ncbi:hypothetical protein [Magnetospirillum sp. UT-4]|uniref:hypothetical protein n=1 Tax=Magnetospirillum sp. UT-4 TaxID=2681467 RepID=UPI00137E42FB|nr:hypothetical protein [Magnetospirillum sp. UT-4]CAA7620786.1 conserved exported hypothetical protein [Magnetospirillum sp. UT-4]